MITLTDSQAVDTVKRLQDYLGEETDDQYTLDQLSGLLQRVKNGRKPGMAKTLQELARDVANLDDCQIRLDSAPYDALCGALLDWAGEQDAAVR